MKKVSKRKRKGGMQRRRRELRLTPSAAPAPGQPSERPAAHPAHPETAAAVALPSHPPADEQQQKMRQRRRAVSGAVSLIRSPAALPSCAAGCRPSSGVWEEVRILQQGQFCRVFISRGGPFCPSHVCSGHHLQRQPSCSGSRSAQAQNQRRQTLWRRSSCSGCPSDL